MELKWGYDKDTDYQKLINEAVGRGNMHQAAMYEAMRNEKIAGEGLGEVPTSLYSSYLGSSGETDYQKELSALLPQKPEAYTWDPDTDPAVSAYKKQYMRQADRTMEDTLGKYATMTGGLPSTAAVTAASQSADNTKAQFSALLPELEQQAYDRWSDQYDRYQSSYSTMINNAVSRWQQLGYADQEVADILGVPVGTMTSDQSYLNWQMGQQDKSDAYNLAMTMISAGQMPSGETLAAAGMTAADAQALLSAYTASSYSSGSGSSGSGGKTMTTTMMGQIYDAYISGNTEEYENLKKKYGSMGYDVDSYTSVLEADSVTGGEKTGDDVSYGGGLDTQSFSKLAQMVQVYVSSGMRDQLNAFLSGSMAQKMSKEQWDQILALID